MKQRMKLSAFFIGGTMAAAILILFIGAGSTVTDNQSQMNPAQPGVTSATNVKIPAPQQKPSSLDTAGIKENGTALEAQPQVQTRVKL